MGESSQNSKTVVVENAKYSDLQYYTWEQVKEHNKRDDLWLIINNHVYNVTEFQKKHPGGSKLINFYAGKDATVT